MGRSNDANSKRFVRSEPKETRNVIPSSNNLRYTGVADRFIGGH